MAECRFEVSKENSDDEFDDCPTDTKENQTLTTTTVACSYGENPEETCPSDTKTDMMESNCSASASAGVGGVASENTLSIVAMYSSVGNTAERPFTHTMNMNQSSIVGCRENADEPATTTTTASAALVVPSALFPKPEPEADNCLADTKNHDTLSTITAYGSKENAADAPKAAKTTRKKLINSKVQYCAAINCPNSRWKSPHLTFFTFPKPGKKTDNSEAQLERARKWWINTRRCDRNWKDPKDRKSILNLALCEEHFEADALKYPEEKHKRMLRKRLNKDAIPTIFDIPNAPKVTPKRPPPKVRVFKPPPPKKKKNDNLTQSTQDSGEDVSQQLLAEKKSTEAGVREPTPAELPQPPNPNPTPAEIHLKKLVARYRRRCSRSALKLRKTQEQLDVYKLELGRHKTERQKAEDLLSQHLSPIGLQLVLAQIPVRGKDKSKRRNCRFPAEVKLLCAALAKTSPASYRLLRKVFRLPSGRTLQRAASAALADTPEISSIDGPSDSRRHSPEISMLTNEREGADSRHDLPNSSSTDDLNVQGEDVIAQPEQHNGHCVPPLCSDIRTLLVVDEDPES